MPPTRNKTLAFTLLETVIALGLGSLVLIALSSVYQQSLRELRAQRETYAATLGLQERLEQVRALTWLNLLDPAASRSLLQNSANVPLTNSQLPGVRETITARSTNVLGLPLPSIIPTPDAWTLTRDERGNVTGSTAAIGPTALALQLTATYTWQSGSRTRTRSLTTLVTLKLVPL